MKANMPKAKPTPKAMPSTTLTPLSSRKRRKRVSARVTAAVNIDEALYTDALTKARSHHDNNFSGYVRTLLRGDLYGQN